MKTRITLNKVLYISVIAIILSSLSNELNAQVITNYGTGSGTSGSYGSYFGYYAGQANTASYNTFLGYQSGYTNTSGTQNVFVGHRSGYYSTTGSYNIFNGVNSGHYNTSGSNNAFVGGYSGFYNTTGYNNTFLGRSAGYNNTTGAGNVFIGYNAGYYNTTGSNKLYIDNSSTTSPLIYGDFSSNIVTVNGALGIGTTSPTAKLEVVSTGSIGSGDGIDWSNAAIRVSQQGYLLGCDGNQITANKELFINSETSHITFQTDGGTTRMSIKSTGQVGIGLSAGLDVSVWQGALLAVNGGILCEKVKVVSDVPSSDYVFNKDYELLSLPETEKYIKDNKHLPEVPSSEEFKENGYSIGEMDDILLRKIEELTLHIIELNKEIEELKNKTNNNQ